MKKMLIVLTSILAISGCSTGYQKYGFSGGYKDMKLSNNSYMIEYNSNAYTDHGTNVKHALRRAAELTKTSGYKYFKVEKVSDTSTQYTTPVVSNSTADYNSYGHCSYNYYGNGYGTYNGSANGYGNASTVVYGGNTFTRPGVCMVITMQKYKTKDSYDAAIILGNFKN